MSKSFKYDIKSFKYDMHIEMCMYVYNKKTLQILQDNMTMMPWLQQHIKNITINLKIYNEIK